MLTRSVRVPVTADINAIDNAVRSVGASIVWSSDASFGRRYGMLEGDAAGEDVARACASGILFDPAIIAVAVTPSTPEALPLIEAALVGEGRPSGVMGCDLVGDSAIIEWDMQRTSAALVLAIVDLELGRLRASRQTRVLVPMSANWIAQIAAEGLRAPEIAANRVLEERLRECHVVD